MNKLRTSKNLKQDITKNQTIAVGMSSSRGSWFDVEDEDENEKLEINGKVLKFRNKTCRDCGKRASVYILASAAIPKKLYYKCDNKGCNFFRWCKPSMYEYRVLI